MKKQECLMVSRKVGTFWPASIDATTLKEAVEFMQQKEAMFGPNAILSYEQAQYDDYYEFVIYEQRPETDDEFNARVAGEDAYQQNQEAQERAEFERLSKKFAKEAK